METQVAAYTLGLSHTDRLNFIMAGVRCGADRIMHLINCCIPEGKTWSDPEATTISIPVHIALKIRGIAEAEEYEFPCFDGLLKSKLVDFCRGIVGESVQTEDDAVPVKKSKIYFYRERSDVPEGAVRLVGSYENISGIIDSFNNRELKELYAPAIMVTGWRASLTPDECEIVFLGQGWDRSEIAQGRERLNCYLHDEDVCRNAKKVVLIGGASEPMGDRIKKACDEANDAFCSAIARHFPEAVSGDLDLSDDAALLNAMEDVATIWVTSNVPSLELVSKHWEDLLAEHGFTYMCVGSLALAGFRKDVKMENGVPGFLFITKAGSLKGPAFVTQPVDVALFINPDPRQLPICVNKQTFPSLEQYLRTIGGMVGLSNTAGCQSDPTYIASVNIEALEYALIVLKNGAAIVVGTKEVEFYESVWTMRGGLSADKAVPYLSGMMNGGSGSFIRNVMWIDPPGFDLVELSDGSAITIGDESCSYYSDIDDHYNGRSPVESVSFTSKVAR